MALGALADIDLLTRACDFLLPHIEVGESKAIDALQYSASTTHVNALRSFRVQRTIIAVGMFSLFESTLQSEYGWPDAFRELDRTLQAAGETELSQEFRVYRLAVNVLKHGAGRSHDELLASRGELPFRVRSMDEFFEEGDVVEGQSLIEVDDHFIRAVAKLIESIRIRLAEGQA